MWWLLVATAVFAHVEPSPEADNRYVKITLLPRQVRVAYLVFFGERPGAAARVRMDTDGDGALSEGEASAFGDSVLAEVAPRITVEIDGAKPGAKWSVADVGLGTPLVRGGAFSVDLVMMIPVAAGTEHVVSLRDGWRPPTPGEAELRVEAAPEVEILEAHRGPSGRGIQTSYSDPSGDVQDVTVRFRGPAPPAVAPAPPSSRWRTKAIAVAIALAILALGWAVFRRSR